MEFFGRLGGEIRGGISRPGGRFQQLRPVAHITHMTINERLRWSGRKRAWDGVAAMFRIGGNWSFLAFGGGRIEVAFCDRAGYFDGSTGSSTSPT